MFDNIQSSLGPADCMHRFLNWNLVDFYQTRLTPADGTNQFSSHVAGHNGELLWKPERYLRWMSSGMFRIYDPATVGSKILAFGGLNKILVRGQNGGAEDLTLTLTDGDYIGPEAMRVELETQLNALTFVTGSNGDLNGNFTVTFHHELSSGFLYGDTAANFKWTIANTGASKDFDLIGVGTAQNALPIFGIHNGSYADASVTGASTYTGSFRACHTEEHLIFDIGDVFLTITSTRPYTTFANRSITIQGGTVTAYAPAFTWLAFVDSNFRPTGGLGNTSDNNAVPGGAADVKYFHVLFKSSTSFDSKALGSYTIGTDRFDIDQVGPGEYGPFIDTAMWDDQPSGIDMLPLQTSPPSSLFLYRFDKSPSATDPILGEEFVKIMISDPTHPHGHLYCGKVYVGPGWHFSRDISVEHSYSMVSQDIIGYATEGDSYAAVQKSYRTCSINLGSGNPFRGWDASTWAYMMATPKRPQRTNLDHFLPHSQNSAGTRQPFIYLSMDSIELDGGPTSAHTLGYDVTKWAVHGLYGRFNELPDLSTTRHAGIADRWTASYTIREEPFG